MFNNLKVKVAAAVTAAFAFVGGANAAVPTEATTAITGIQTDGEAMIAAGWPVVAAIVSGFILIKIFKKVMDKVS